MDRPRIQKSAPLADQAFELMRNMIVLNEVAPGQVITENELATSFGISRATLREAMARLERDGLVEVIPWKGTRISPIPAKYVQDVYELRAALERVAARKAAPRLRDMDLDRMERELEALYPLLERGETGPQHEMERDFHGLYVDMCDNELLREDVSRLYIHLARILVYVGSASTDEIGLREHSIASYEEHRKMLGAMRTKDPNVLEDAVVEHISRVAQRLADLVAKIESR